MEWLVVLTFDSSPHDKVMRFFVKSLQSAPAAESESVMQELFASAFSADVAEVFSPCLRMLGAVACAQPALVNTLQSKGVSALVAKVRRAAPLFDSSTHPARCAVKIA